MADGYKMLMSRLSGTYGGGSIRWGTEGGLAEEVFRGGVRITEQRYLPLKRKLDNSTEEKSAST